MTPPDTISATEKSKPSALEIAVEKAAKAAAKVKKLEREAFIKKKKAERAEKNEARKLDTRTLILIGAAFKADLTKHPTTRQMIEVVLKRNIGKPKDLELLKAAGWMKDVSSTGSELAK